MQEMHFSWPQQPAVYTLLTHSKDSDPSDTDMHVHRQQ